MRFNRCGGKTSDSVGIRTQDPLIKSQMLYQLSYGVKCTVLNSGAKI